MYRERAKMLEELRNKIDFFIRNNTKFSRKNFVEKDEILLKINERENLYIQDILDLMISSCANAFETMPIFEYRDILRNILYSGIWTKYKMIKERKRK